MKINTIVYERSWILEKISQEFHVACKRNGLHSELSHTQFVHSCDIYFHVWYLYASVIKSSYNVAYVTHVDEEWKLRRLDDLVSAGVSSLICLSNDMCISLSRRYPNLPVRTSIPGSTLCSETYQKKTFRIGYLSRLYSDGRKNENWLLDLASSISPEDVSFSFIGEGWLRVCYLLASMGFEFSWQPEYIAEKAPSQMAHIDLFVYTGFDEGSIGVLDCLSQSKPCLVSGQGFHKELRLIFPNLVELFKDYDDFMGRVKLRISAFTDSRSASHKFCWKNSSEHLVTTITSLYANSMSCSN